MGIVDFLMERPLIYRVWQAPFAARKLAPVERYLRSRSIRRVLDVGCGPGTNASRFAAADYVGVDINEHYLDLARRRFPGRFERVDLNKDDLSSFGHFDFVLVNSILHHLPDSAVRGTLENIGRVLTPDGRVHLLELVRPPGPCLAQLLADLDRGRYARTLEAWQTLVGETLTIVDFTPYMLGGRLWSMVYFQGKAK